MSDRRHSWSAVPRLGAYTVAAIVWRAGCRCTWCARVVTKETYSIDHVVPRAQGGDDQHTNLVLACRECNNQRYALGVVPMRAIVAGRSYEVCVAEIARQTSIPVGRGTEANAAARDLAATWFGDVIARNLVIARESKARRAAGVDPTSFPFGANAEAA